MGVLEQSGNSFYRWFLVEIYKSLLSHDGKELKWLYWKSLYSVAYLSIESLKRTRLSDKQVPFWRHEGSNFLPLQKALLWLFSDVLKIGLRVVQNNSLHLLPMKNYKWNEVVWFIRWRFVLASQFLAIYCYESLQYYKYSPELSMSIVKHYDHQKCFILRGLWGCFGDNFFDLSKSRKSWKI